MERLGLGPDELRTAASAPDLRLDQRRRRQRALRARSGSTIRSSRACRASADIQSQPVTNRPQMIRTIVCDKTTAVFTAQAVSSALYAREKTGQGDHIQVAMLDVMISYLWPEGMMQYTVVGARSRGRRSRRTGPTSCSRPATATSPRHDLGFRVAGLLPRDRRSGTRGRSALCDARRACGQRDRAHQQDGRIHRAAHHRRMAGAARCRRRALRADPASRRDHPQRAGGGARPDRRVRSAGGRPRAPAEAGGAVFEVNGPSIGGPAPRVGEHSREVLRELGYADDAIDKMVSDRAVRVAG